MSVVAPSADIKFRGLETPPPTELMALPELCDSSSETGMQRVVTRCDELAANYLAFVKLAPIRIWLSGNEPTPWSGIPKSPRVHAFCRGMMAAEVARGPARFAPNPSFSARRVFVQNAFA
jgi:hypothetical protein